MSLDLVVRGGRVAGAVADVGVAGERIAAIGPGLEGAQEIDAGGRLVSPAFVQPRLGEKRSERVVDVLDQQLVVAAVVVPPA